MLIQSVRTIQVTLVGVKFPTWHQISTEVFYPGESCNHNDIQKAFPWLLIHPTPILGYDLIQGLDDVSV